MGFPDGSEGGVRSPFSNRVGIDLPTFRGTNRQDDPGAIGEDQFWTLQNVRVDGAGVGCRNGLSEVFTNAMDDCIYGIWDDRNPPDDGDAIFMASRQAYGPQVWAADPLQPSGYGRIAAPFNGAVIYVDDAGIGHLVDYTTTDGVPAFTSVEVFTYASTFADPAVLGALEFQGALYFVVYGNDQTYNEIWRWTGGATAELEISTGIENSAYANIATDGNDIYYSSQSVSGDQVRKRNGGTWDDLTMPAGAGTNWTPVGWNGVSKPPYVYMAGFDADEADVDKVIIILQILDETVTVLSNAVPTWNGTTSTYGLLAEMDGALYIAGPVTNGTDSYRLFQITGSGTPTVVANLTTQLAVGDIGQTALLQLYTWRNQLYGSFPSTPNAVFARSAVGDTTTWTSITVDNQTVTNTDGFPIYSA